MGEKVVASFTYYNFPGTPHLKDSDADIQVAEASVAEVELPIYRETVRQLNEQARQSVEIGFEGVLDLTLLFQRGLPDFYREQLLEMMLPEVKEQVIRLLIEWEEPAHLVGMFEPTSAESDSKLKECRINRATSYLVKYHDLVKSGSTFESEEDLRIDIGRDLWGEDLDPEDRMAALAQAEEQILSKEEK